MPLPLAHGAWSMDHGPWTIYNGNGIVHGSGAFDNYIAKPPSCRFRTYGYRTVIIQVSMTTFVQDLENHVLDKLSRLDLLKESEIGPVDRSEIVRRLKIALKNELEASEIADRKSTRLNSSHLGISYAVFCLKNK